MFNITNRCNFSCKTCLREKSSNQDLPLETIEKVIPTLRTLGVQHIALTGGEPIMHPEFENVLDIITAADIKISLVTNSWLYEKYLTCLEKHRDHVYYVAISLDGHNAELHDKNRIKRSFRVPDLIFLII